MKTNDNSYIAAPKPSEAKYLTSISIPYDSYEHALTAIPKSYRHIGLTININKNEYWF